MHIGNLQANNKILIVIFVSLIYSIELSSYDFEKYNNITEYNGTDHRLELRVAFGHDMQIALRYSAYNAPVVCHVLHPLLKFVDMEIMYDYDVGK